MLLSISEGFAKCNFGFFNGTTVETTSLTADGSLILYTWMMKTEKLLAGFMSRQSCPC
jgi:hypothetical protein